ncbi:MAG: OsmC family protein [Crocinitomicaceae bacterium]|jgi:putative redox protein
MKIELNRIEEPYVFQLQNQTGAICVFDANEALGGKNKGLTPMQLLAGSLAGCMSIDIILILQKQKINPSIYRVEIDAKRKEGTPAPFEAMHLIFTVDQNVPVDKLERAIVLSKEKYCSVSLSLNPAINITYEVKVIS